MHKKLILVFAMIIFSLAVIPIVKAGHVSCGDTITTDTTLDSDLTCPSGIALTMGANNIFLDCADHTITGTGTGVGIVATNKQNIIIKNCIVQNFDEGIIFTASAFFGSTTQSQLINNTANNNGIGFSLSTHSSSNTLTNNTANNNSFYGFSLDFSSNSNTLTNNFIENNPVGISILFNSNNNLIFNNFFNNTVNAEDNGVNNWNITKTAGTNIIGGNFFGGNFWSDYIGADLDSDGLGDTLLPYNSNGNIVNGGDFLPLVTKAVSCGDTITTDTTLDSDLTCAGTALTIGADSIFLDCADHSITGDGTGFGILAQSRQNITIKNCIVQNFNNGIGFDSTTQSHLINNTAQNNNLDGFRLFSSSNSNTLTDNTANNNGRHGFLLSSSHSNTLTSNTANNNIRRGIRLDLSNSNLLTNNTINFEISGILLVSSNSNTLTNNTANDNTFHGFHFETSSNNILTSNTVNNNNQIGFALLHSSNNNTLTSNFIENNLVGVRMITSFNNLIFNNFFNNTLNARDDSNNFWNITKTSGTNIIGGPFLGGNFWSDYAGVDTDGDGLGDTNLPYNSGGNIVNGGDLLPLTTAVTSVCVAAPSNLVSWWPLDETSGTTTADIVNGNPGTLINGPVFTTGKVANALSFDGVNDFVEVPDDPSLNFGTGDFTFDAWIKASSTQVTFPQIMSKRSGHFNGFLFGLWFDGSLYVRLGDKNYAAIGPDLRDDKWHHVAAVRSGTTGTYYIDGVSSGGFVSGKNISVVADLWIGRDFPALSATPFRGNIDEVEIFNRALSASEIQAIFNAGGAGKCKIDQDPIDIIKGLIASIESLNLEQGIENSLVGKMKGFVKEKDPPSTAKEKEKEPKPCCLRIIKMIDASINEVEALRGKKLTDEEADSLALIYNSARSNVSN